MTHKIDISKYPKLTSISEFIKNQFDEDPDNIYMANHITNDDLHALNTPDINPNNINTLLDVCDYLEISHNYIWNNAKGDFEYHKDYAPFLYKFHVVTLTSPSICNEYFLEKYKKHMETIIIVCGFVNNLDIINYYITKGCLKKEMNPDTLIGTQFQRLYDEAISIYAPSLKWEVIIPFVFAIVEHDISVLKQLRQWGCKLTSLIFHQSVIHKTSIWTQYCHENGCELGDELISMSLFSDTLDNLIYLHEHGCKWNPIDITRGLGINKIEHVVYMIENGCQYDNNEMGFYVGIAQRDVRIFKAIYKRENNIHRVVPVVAAQCGNYELLAYLMTLGEPFTQFMLEYAIHFGDNLECLILALQNGCDVTEEVLRHANKETRPKCYSYLKEHGYEPPIHQLHDISDSSSLSSGSSNT